MPSGETITAQCFLLIPAVFAGKTISQNEESLPIFMILSIGLVIPKQLAFKIGTLALPFSIAGLTACADSGLINSESFQKTFLPPPKLHDYLNRVFSLVYPPFGLMILKKKSKFYSFNLS